MQKLPSSRAQFAERINQVGRLSIKMGVLKSGFLFLVFTVCLYPIFVTLLTVPWLQRQ